MPSEARQKELWKIKWGSSNMLNFGASKPRVKGGGAGAGAQPPPRFAPAE